MRERLPDNLEEHRIREGEYGSQPGMLYGAFAIQGPCGMGLAIISSGTDLEYMWEHVSVSGNRRPPNWEEMCWVKDLFWDDEETVVQFHPPKSEYVNMHPHCLHLWKPLGRDIPRPNSILVGPLKQDGGNWS
jgi:hypothetical protein